MPSDTKLPTSTGFSFIELITVVALIAIIVSSAIPVASSLFRRHREMQLRETLLILRLALSDFSHNGLDDDLDSGIDEDARGDMNYDGRPGIMGIDDDSDLQIDEDWGYRKPFLLSGSINPIYDWRFRVDDDEDDSRDEEAFAGDLSELALKMPILNRKIPIDPVSKDISWYPVFLHEIGSAALLANNDSDYYHDDTGDNNFTVPTKNNTPPPVMNGDSIVVSTSPVFFTPITIGNPAQTMLVSRIILAGENPPTADNDPLVALTNEDPRNGIDDDADGRRDEDATELIDVRSMNTTESIDLTLYSSW